MDDFLAKINFVKKNNYINKLEKDNKRNEERIEKYISNFKKEITEQELAKKEYQKAIKQLSESNQKLETENAYYKHIINKIPNFIIRMFVGKKNLGGYLNG